MIQNHIWNLICFLKILFRPYVFIFVHKFQCRSPESFFFFSIIRFSSRKSQYQQKLAKMIAQFTIQFRSKNLTHFTTLSYLALKIICIRHTVKNLSEFTNFPEKIFLFGVRKNICAAPFLDSQEPYSWSIFKADACIFLYISVNDNILQYISVNYNIFVPILNSYFRYNSRLFLGCTFLGARCNIIGALWETKKE